MNNNIKLGQNTITPEQYQNLINSSLSPDVGSYYDQLTQNRVADVETAGEYQANSYRNQLQQLFDDYTAAKAEQDDNEGRSGTWSSSERQARLNRLANRANLNSENLFNASRNNLNNLYREGEYNLGNSFNKQGLDKFSFSADQSIKPSKQNAGGYAYNPFGFYGTQNSERYGAQRTSANTALKNLFNNPYSTK
jgi:hypothetical protein